MANKRPKKKYVPKPVYYPGLVIHINSFKEFEKALNNFLDKQETEIDSEGTFVFKNSAGVVQAFDCAIYVYLNLTRIYASRSGKVFNLKPLAILQNRMYERRGFDEEEILEAKEALNICSDIVKKIPAPEVRDILAIIKGNIAFYSNYKPTLNDPASAVNYYSYKLGDLSESEVWEKNLMYQQLALENPEDKFILSLRDDYAKFSSAHRFLSSMSKDIKIRAT